ncbi:MAG: SH3 domain-containing protein, partial [Chloroflexota bacterium]|nr:SH3 domain-containing protein [Chloroflexota bacterium]
PVSYRGFTGFASASYLSTGGGSAGSGAATVTSELNLRAGPSTGDRVLTVMPSGATVTLTGQSSNGFLSVTYNGTAGWAYSAYIGSGGGGDDDGGGAVVDTAWTTSSLNLRAGPSTATAVLTVMPSGAMLETTGASQSGFYPVVYSGQAGWASATYLSFSGPPATTPPPDPSGDIISIIYAAADRYGQDREAMLRVARCESNLIPTAYNPSSAASGLFQFLPSTWATTIYADYDIFDAWASANAAAWMWSVGRRNEWVCQ